MEENNPGSKKINPDDEVHVIDGIVELNHPAPFWWQMIYYISIVWAIGYMGYYLFGSGPTLKQELAAKLEKISESQKAKKPSEDDEKKELRAFFNDTGHRTNGAAVFTKNCGSCHAADGGGGIGPNLTDNAWIHGDGSIDAIYATVKNGVPEKGMPPWGPILKREEVLEVSAYVRFLRDHAPEKAKAPQGNTIAYKPDL